MLVLDTEERPQAPPADLGEGDEETECLRLLHVAGEDGVEDPVEADCDVRENGDVVHPRTAECERLAQEWVSGVGVAETPVHGDVPDGCVDGV